MHPKVTDFRVRSDVLARRIGDEIVLVNVERDEIFALNSTGARLWELVNDGRTREEAVSQLTVEFDVTHETAAREADALLATLIRDGLIQPEGH
jgi:hypothetical protein